MKKLILKYYHYIFRIFLKKIGSDRATSRAAAISLTSFTISVMILIIINFGLKLLTNKSYFFELNKIYIFFIFFVIYLLTEFKIKNIIDKNFKV